MNLTRKEFLGSILKGTAGVAGVALLVGAGCGGDDSGTPDAAHHPDGSSAAANCEMNGTTDVIAANHGHVLTVSKEDVTAGADKTYDIMGTATHTHSVEITAAMFTMLQGNMTIMTTSSTTAQHSHMITVSCAT
ncbi:MAG TPA: hypothetical protein VGM88_32470 [Kofleriaceae bacterium]|jgi:hypothetical protein